MVGEEVGVGVIGAAVMGAAVGEGDGVFVGALEVAGTKIVGRLVVPGLGMVVIVDGAGGGLAVSCARAVLVPPVAERTVAATSHIFLPLVYTLSFSRWAIASLECDVGSKDANILQWKEIDNNMRRSAEKKVRGKIQLSISRAENEASKRRLVTMKENGSFRSWMVRVSLRNSVDRLLGASFEPDGADTVHDQAGCWPTPATFDFVRYVRTKLSETKP